MAETQTVVQLVLDGKTDSVHHLLEKDLVFKALCKQHGVEVSKVSTEAVDLAALSGLIARLEKTLTRNGSPDNQDTRDKLKSYLRQRKLTQMGFARQVGLSKSTVCSFLAGRNLPPDTLKKLASGLS